MSSHIHSLKVGEELSIKGPIPKFDYKPNQFDEIALIAGGSGVTPMWQSECTIFTLLLPMRSSLSRMCNILLISLFPFGTFSSSFLSYARN